MNELRAMRIMKKIGFTVQERVNLVASMQWLEGDVVDD